MFLPLMLSAMGALGVFIFYAGTNLLALVMIFLLMPETKQRTLEELDYVFAVPTREFMRYQTRSAAPWWFKTWVLRRKVAALEPLYTFDRVEGSDKERIEGMRERDRRRAERRENESAVPGEKKPDGSSDLSN